MKGDLSCIFLCLCVIFGYSIGFELTLLHTNDVHAHYEQFDKYHGACDQDEENDGKCYGGVSRRKTKIDEIRDGRDNVILLDAGDRFLGTLWFYQYQGLAAALFMKQLQYDAMCLGNHEFDLGVAGLVPFLLNMSSNSPGPVVPVLSSNLDVQNEPRLQGKFSKSTVLTVGAEKIAVIGYTTTETSSISNAGKNVSFDDEIQSVREEIAVLKASAQGINKFIALGHAGYTLDKKLAVEVEDIDIVVGGHSNTFLYTGEKPPLNDDIEGPYPTVIEQTSGRKVLVVQDFAFGKYLGHLNVTFDTSGEVVSWGGNPILLDNTTAQDPTIEATVTQMALPLEAIKSEIVGHSAVFLEGERKVCRVRECNLGNLLADGMVSFHTTIDHSNTSWTRAAIALMNSGGIRASIEAGTVSMGDVLSVLTFGNEVDLVTIKGRYLKEVLEQAVQKYNPTEPPGGFLQVSGVQVVYDVTKSPGNRVVSVKVRCADCMVPKFSVLEMEKEYDVLTVSFLINGGDGFTVLRDKITAHVRLNNLDNRIFRKNLEDNMPVIAGVEGRITFLTGDTSGVSSYHSLSSLSQALLLIAVNLYICL